MTLKHVRSVTLSSRRYLSGKSHYTAQEIKIPVPWGHIAAKSWGNPSGAPIIGLHGWLDNAATMDGLAPLLPLDKYNFVSIDMPGHGLSSHYPRGMTYKASDSFFLLHWIQDHFKWEKSKLIAHSLGAGLAALYCAIFPERVERAVLLDLINIGPSPVEKQVHKARKAVKETVHIFGKLYGDVQHRTPSYTFEDAMGRAYMANCIIHGMDSMFKSSVETLLKRGLTKVEGTEDRYTWNTDLRLRIPGPLNVIYEQVEAYAHAIKSPLLIVKASNSPYYMSEEVAERLLRIYADSVPNFEFRVVEGGHHVHLNEPEKVAPHVLSFLERDFGEASSEKEAEQAAAQSKSQD